MNTPSDPPPTESHDDNEQRRNRSEAPQVSSTGDQHHAAHAAHVAEELSSPRTSFCLLEVTAEDRDSTVSSQQTTHSPASHLRQHASRAPSSRRRVFTPATNASRNLYHDQLPPSCSSSSALRSPRKTYLHGASSTAAMPSHPSSQEGGSQYDHHSVADSTELDALQGLFRVDASVYTNPDNIVPSLQTSIIMGESQIVDQNGSLASLYPDSRRQRRATDAIARQESLLPPLPAALYGVREQLPSHLHHHSGETSTMDGDSPIDPSIMTGASDDDDRSSGDTGRASDTNRRLSYWHQVCGCCFGQRGRSTTTASAPFYKESMTIWEFTQSLWARVHTDWDSYLLFFTLALAIMSIPVAVTVAAILSASHRVAFHARCQFRIPNTDMFTIGVSTASISAYLIPAMNHIVLLFVSLWIAIRCSISRKRVLKSSSMTATLTSAFMLPCYEVIWYTISALNVVGLVLQTVSVYPAILPSGSSNTATSTGRLQLQEDASYPCDVIAIPFVWMLQLLPFLMAQHSVSHEAVRRAVAHSCVVCVLLLVLQLTLYKEGAVAMDLIAIGVDIALLTLYGWSKFASHARSSFDFFFVVAVIDGLATLTVDSVALASRGGTAVSPSSLMVAYCVVRCLDAVLTVAVLLSLRADTRYWLGIDDSNTSTRHPFKQYMTHLSERGMITNFSTRTSVYDVHHMIEEHRKSVVDFSALQLECVIGQGATSIVMRGTLRPNNKPIALKIYTSVQVTDEEVHRFSRETALNVQLSHPNIVKFYGLCVVPPSISLVFEFCEYGGLDSVLRNGSMHSLATKLRAWLDACRAVAYLHSFTPPLLHRDIKTDNFLVGQDFTLKLADFGEANLLKPRSDGTMTIAGTVDYMAPEMILGGKTARYGTGVDVYSLMVTLWQIMVPDRSPWEGRSHLEVYKSVTNGERPPLLPSIPSGCAAILEAGWVANPSERVAVEDIIPKVHQLWLLSTHQKTLKRTK